MILLIFKFILSFGFVNAVAATSTTTHSECAASLGAKELIEFEGFFDHQLTYDLTRKSVLEVDLSYYQRIAVGQRQRIEKLEAQLGEDPKDEASANQIKYAKNDLREVESTLTTIAGKISIHDQAAAITPASAQENAAAEIRHKVAKNAQLRRYLREYFNFMHLTQFDPLSVYILWLGSRDTEPTPGEVESARETLKAITASGRIVFLDGHSKLTPEIISAADGRAIAIVNGPASGLQAKYTIRLENPALLLEVIGRYQHILTSRTSTIGMALMMYDSSVSILDADTKSSVGLRDWSQSLSGKWSFGLRSYNERKVYANFDEYVRHRVGPGSLTALKHPPNVSRKPIKQFSVRSLKEASRYANNMYLNMPLVRGPDAVMFGSGQMSKRASPLVYDIAYQLGRYGVGVATGGSGGAMLAANMGSFDAGGDSLGIPLGRRLAGEEKTYSDVQTRTVPASGYATRIAWLLDRRKLILVSPGGDGTLREIVASLIKMAHDPGRQSVLVFLNREYYQGLFDHLMQQPLGEELHSRIGLVDSTDELRQFLKDQTRAGHFDITKYQSVSTPRSGRNTLPEFWVTPPMEDKSTATNSDYVGASFNLRWERDDDGDDDDANLDDGEE